LDRWRQRSGPPEFGRVPALALETDNARRHSASLSINILRLD
jgi:hypothetical protein